MAIDRTENTPWQVINLMTNETLGWYASDMAAAVAHEGEPVSIIYRPKKKRKNARTFP